MTCRNASTRLWLCPLIGASALLVTLPARATPEDDAALETASAVLDEEYARADFAEAKKKLDDALAHCGDTCSPRATARLHIELGMVSSQVGDAAAARRSFGAAMKIDPLAQLPDRGTSPSIRAFWKEVVATTPGAERATHEYALRLADAAAMAARAGNFVACAENDRASLEMEDKPTTRLHLSACDANIGKLMQALKDAQAVLELALAKGDAPLVEVAKKQIETLAPRVPHVTFVAPATPAGQPSNLTVKLDGRVIPEADLSKSFSVDPGKHEVMAERIIDGKRAVFARDYIISAGEHLSVVLDLATVVTPPSTPPSAKPTTITAALETSGYSDTNNIRVLAPSVRVGMSSPAKGWNVGGRYQADVISAASPDVVSASSRRWNETRHVGMVTGGYKPGATGFQATAHTFNEPDRATIDGGLAVSTELSGRQLVPRIAYVYGHDTIGRTGTPFDSYSKSATTHEIEAGATMLLSPASVLTVNGRVDLDRGDRSNPYRNVPMFDPAAAQGIKRGDSYPTLDAVRIPFAPLEQLPSTRQRYALIVNYNYRLSSPLPSTLRLEERLYTDSWSISATTTDVRWLANPGQRFTLGPHVRLHAQTGANFHQLAYSAPTTMQGAALGVLIPKIRSGDRELSPLVTVTFGASARIKLSEPDAPKQFTIVLQGDYAQTRYFDVLYLTTRAAGFGSIGIEGEWN